MDSGMSYEEAVKPIKERGFKVVEILTALKMDRQALHRACHGARSHIYVMAINGFLAERHEAYKSMIKHKGVPAMDAAINSVVELGKELDGKVKDDD